MAFVTALAVGLVALALAPGRAFYFDVTPKLAALLAATALLLILAARRRRLPGAPPRFTALLLLNAGSLALSTAFSANRGLSLYGGSWRGWGALAECAAMLFAWLVARQPDAHAVLWSIAIAGVPAAIFGTLGDPGSLAVWLAMGACLAMALAQMEPRRLWRTAAWAASAAALAALIVTGVKSAPWAGAHGSLWRDTLSMAADRPLAGFGSETFLAQFPHFESKALAQVSPDSFYESPRNALLDTLVAQGVPGLLLLCGLTVLGMVSAWKRGEGWIAAALLAGIAGLQFTAFRIPTAILFFTTVALAVRPTESQREPRPMPVLVTLAPFAVLALLYLALRVTVADRELVVTRRLLDARDLRAATAEYEIYWFWRLPGANADIWYSRTWLAIARNATNPDVRAQAMAIAVEAAARATENAEEPGPAFYNLAQVSLAQQDYDEARHDLRLAIASHPNWYLPRRALAQELLRQSRMDEERQRLR
ncbi:MAG TPA: hypothetical protein VHW09_22960 [Bryobacteraceae bacterium]|jgi:tetratricopeptide (TPR) repeat protein|nr:hypothetical protein [Bryobacteraceae bacterium]